MHPPTPTLCSRANFNTDNTRKMWLKIRNEILKRQESKYRKKEMTSRKTIKRSAKADKSGFVCQYANKNSAIENTRNKDRQANLTSVRPHLKNPQIDQSRIKHTYTVKGMQKTGHIHNKQLVDECCREDVVEVWQSLVWRLNEVSTREWRKYAKMTEEMFEYFKKQINRRQLPMNERKRREKGRQLEGRGAHEERTNHKSYVKRMTVNAEITACKINSRVWCESPLVTFMNTW